MNTERDILFRGRTLILSICMAVNADHVVSTQACSVKYREDRDRCRVGWERDRLKLKLKLCYSLQPAAETPGDVTWGAFHVAAEAARRHCDSGQWPPLSYLTPPQALITTLSNP